MGYENVNMTEFTQDSIRCEVNWLRVVSVVGSVVEVLGLQHFTGCRVNKLVNPLIIGSIYQFCISVPHSSRCHVVIQYVLFCGSKHLVRTFGGSDWSIDKLDTVKRFVIIKLRIWFSENLQKLSKQFPVIILITAIATTLTPPSFPQI
jgi:hypothetical protein